MPARLHRQVLGAVRRAGDRGGAPGDRRRLLRFHGRQGRSADPPAGAGDADAAADLDFEKAARLRDDLGALRRAVEKQAVVLGDGTDADVVGIVADELQASVQVFHVRGGRVRGQRGWIVDVDADAGDRGRAARTRIRRWCRTFLLQFYGGRAADDGATAVPREILVPALPADADELAVWLSGLRGSSVSLRVPQRGDKRALAETVTRNAAEALAQHRLRRAGDLTARSAALRSSSATLGMDTAPLRIECIDVSHVQGTDVVASLVVFEDGLPKRVGLSALRHPGAPGRRRGVDRRGGPAPVHPRRDGSASGSPACRRPDRDAGDAVGRPTAGSIRPPAGHRPRDRATAAVRLSAATAGGGRRGAAGERRFRRARRSAGSPTSPSAGWRSGSRRSGCPARTTR